MMKNAPLLRLSILAIICALAAAALAARPGDAVTVDRIVAWIDEDPVALSEVQKALIEYQSRGDVPPGPADYTRLRPALALWIGEQLIVREADRAGIEVPAEAVDNEIEPMIARLETREGGPQKLDMLLERTGETRQSLRDQLREQMRREWTIARFVQSRVTLSDADVEAFVKKRQAEGKATRRFYVAHFFLPLASDAPEADVREAMDVAHQLRLQVARRRDFLEVAVEFAQRYTRSGAQAGRLGALEPAEMEPELLRAIEATQVGRTSEPVRTSRGLHVLYLERETTARQILSSIRFEEEKAKLVDELRNRATIRILDDRLKP